MNNYTITTADLEAIKAFEGCRLTSYQDSKGVWTIGFGHTKGVKAGMQISQAQAVSLLRADVANAEEQVRRLGVCKTQGQHAALTDFVFNVGIGNLESSTLLNYIIAQKPTAEIQKQFKRWVYAGKKKLKGLVKRREWEAIRWAQE